MASSISSSINISSLTPSLAFKPKSKFLSRRSILRNPLPTQKYTLPFSTSVRLFPQFQIGCILKPKLRTHVASSASGTEVAVEEAADSETSVAPTDAPEISVESSETSAAKSKRTRPSRKSEMPPVKDEDLKPGSTFTGKVRSIQPFGAFIDFGAFTDGLVHVSQLSDSFVKDVASVVSVGQEVTVRLVEANLDTGRISLTMRSGENSNAQQQRDSPAGNDKSRPPRKAGQRDQKSTKFVKGQDLQGTVKNLTRSGAFITLPEGEEGFLPSSEENDDGFVNMMGGSTLEIGQEVNVRVLRIARGKVTLTMKKDEDDVNLDAKLTGKIYTATNPFVLAFRSSDVISSFLDEREKENDPVEEVVKGTDDISSEVSDKGGLENSETDSKEVEESSPVEDQIAEEPSITDAIENNDQASIVEESSSIEDQTAEEPSITDAIENNDQASIVEESSSIEDQTAEEPSITDAIENNDQASIVEESSSIEDQTAEEPSITEAIENKDQAAVVEDVEETAVPLATESEFKSSEDSLPIDATEKELSGELIDENLANTDEEVKSEIADNIIAEDEVQGETINSTSVEEETAALNLEKDESTESPVKEDEVEIPTSADPSQNGNVSSDASPQETVVKAAISPALVKQLRDETGAGMMDCKKALAETEGDIVKAQEFLRKKGLASADKKASRATAEGRVDSYIHDSRIGVLIEVNCETDFVARGDIFKELVQDLAMQVAACPQVQYLSTEDVPTEFVEKEKEMESQKEDLLKKPEQIRSKIVDGRIRKRLEELALLEQPFIRDDKVVVKDWVKQTISTIGENIKVKRFVRYNLGEGLEKKSQDFAAEVAAQTASKPASTAVNPEPAAASENKETTEEPPKVAVSAALVKQLRDETGAGMMDCKKALAETGGDLTKAQEYLRKKGLSTADKKSSRLAAEGRIGSYIHDSRIGVLIEVNCETDFVGRSEKFKELVDDLAMQVVASPQVQYVSIEDIPESIRNKEKEMEMQREDVQSKPENIREKMVEGRVTKRLSELALLEQSYIKADGMLVKDLVKQTVAALGENMKVRRFVRFTLGETRGVEVEN